MLPKLDLNMLTEEVENKQHLERNDTTKKYSNDIKGKLRNLSFS